MVAQSGDGNAVYSTTHTLALTDEHLIQNGLFSQRSKASITARAGVLIIQSITAAQCGTSRQCS